MTKRIKKPAVAAELRRDWLRRFEESGESPPQIARADGYDVRTVRKQIEAERQDRERREARSIVLRRAVEAHFADLCGFAKKIGAALEDAESDLSALRNDRLWLALKEHLPRSPIWRSLDKWDRLQADIRQSEMNLDQSLQDLVKAKSPVKFPVAPHEVGMTAEIISALYNHARDMAEGRPGIDLNRAYITRPADGGTTSVSLGPLFVGRIPDKQVKDVRQLLAELLQEVTKLPEWDELARRLRDLAGVRQLLDDELAIITMRRIVPGRCRYCPL
ncbi:MAG: hypothetical protein QUS33_12120 [Dehalococcoidia bacterium]|nr:hypothetical protein [Dehalococcoidia bacterium]